MNWRRRCETERQDDRMASGVMKVVSSTRNRLMPSMPRWWLMRNPAASIQGADSSNCIPPRLPSKWPSRGERQQENNQGTRKGHDLDLPLRTAGQHQQRPGRSNAGR